jgi:hypothetical protein
VVVSSGEALVYYLKAFSIHRKIQCIMHMDPVIHRGRFAREPSHQRVYPAKIDGSLATSEEVCRIAILLEQKLGISFA